MSDQITVREAREEDHPYLVAFMAGLQDHERQIEANRSPGDVAGASHLAFLQSEIARDGGAIFVADLGAQPVGFIICQFLEEPGTYVLPGQRRYGFVADFFVVSEARGSGAAQAIIDHATDYFRDEGVSVVRLYVLAGNEMAQRFYDKAGFRTYERVLEHKL